MDGLQRLRTKFTVDLHPSKLANATAGVRAHLASLLLRWNEDLEGVLLAFRNERVLTQAATIHPYFPFVRLQVAAEVAVFRPQSGMRLVGTVNKVGADYVGLLVLGVVNASIPADQMRPEFRPRLAEHCWVSGKAPRHRLEAGTKVHFDVASVRRHGAFISISGSLQHPGTGAEGFAQPPDRKAAGADAAGRQQAGAQAQGPAQQQQQQPQPESGKKKKDKKKKEKVATAQLTDAPGAAAQQQQQQQPAKAEQQSAGKKAKKHKQQKEQPEVLPQPQANGPAAAAEAAAGGGRPKKEKKRKDASADGAAPAPAVTNGSTEPKPKKQKQKHKG